MKNIIALLSELDRQYSARLAANKRERAAFRGGYISVSRQNGVPYLYENAGGKRRSVTKDRGRVMKLIRARYLDKKIAEQKAALKLIRRFTKTLARCALKAPDPETYITSRFCDCTDELGAVFWNDFQRRNAGRQSQNPFRREDLKIRSNGGTLVRSFSEQIICNVYEELGIPYRYEMKIKVDVTDMGEIPGSYYENGRWYKNYYPDFVILLADGSIIIHEHFGLISDKLYVDNIGERITAYLNGKVVDIDHLIITFPKDVRDVGPFREMLKARVRPQV